MILFKYTYTSNLHKCLPKVSSRTKNWDQTNWEQTVHKPEHRAQEQEHKDRSTRARYRGRPDEDRTRHLGI